MSAAPDIGRALVLARQIGTPWKLLERQYGYGRTRLWMLYRAALAGSDVHEHLGACEDAPADEGSSDHLRAGPLTQPG